MLALFRSANLHPQRRWLMHAYLPQSARWLPGNRATAVTGTMLEDASEQRHSGHFTYCKSGKGTQDASNLTI